MAILISNFLVERQATLLSDKRICLSVRDSSLLKRLYGKGATHISPIALKDQLVHTFRDGSPQPIHLHFS